MPPVTLALMLLGAGAASAGMPGARLWSSAGAVALVLVSAGLLRAAACWHPGMDWRRTARVGAEQITADPYGSVLMVLAVVAAAVLCGALPVMAPLVLGQLLLDAAAVETRARGKLRKGGGRPEEVIGRFTGRDRTRLSVAVERARSGPNTRARAPRHVTGAPSRAAAPLSGPGECFSKAFG